MAFAASKSGYFGKYASVVTRTVPGSAADIIPGVVAAPKQPVDLPGSKPSSPDYYRGRSLSGITHVTSGIGVSTTITQKRFGHTDIRVPDFGGYRKEDKSRLEEGGRESGKLFTYLMVGGAVGVPIVYASKSLVTKFIGSMSAAADVRAMSKIEIKLEEIPEGKNMVFKWRGKPLFVRHRTAEEIEDVRSVNVAELRDPQHDTERVKEDNWLVILGICTHLGCVPIANQGDYGGYYCPCHGSHYDASGRIRRGPAPLNLEIPEYEIDDGLLVVG